MSNGGLSKSFLTGNPALLNALRKQHPGLVEEMGFKDPNAVRVASPYIVAARKETEALQALQAKRRDLRRGIIEIKTDYKNDLGVAYSTKSSIVFVDGQEREKD